MSDEQGRVTAGGEDPTAAGITPFVEISRADWSALAESTELHLTEAELTKIRGLGDELDLAEVEQVYLPLSQLLNLYVTNSA
ncbi:MAG: putative pantothenate kinase, partial [Actinomycetota bacterium]